MYAAERSRRMSEFAIKSRAGFVPRACPSAASPASARLRTAGAIVSGDAVLGARRTGFTNRVAARRVARLFATRLTVMVCVAAAWLLPGAGYRLQAQGTWEYNPYRVHVWLAVKPSAWLPDALQRDVLDQLVAQAHVYAGATWRLTSAAAPASLTSTLVTVLDQVTMEQLIAGGEDVLAHDKLMLLSVQEENGELLIACREVDCHTRTFGLVYRSRTQQLDRLARDCMVAVATAFSPLVRVEQARGRAATVRVRAGGLVHPQAEHCVSLVQEGDVLRPVIRRNDRSGEPKPDGIQEVDWTYLLVRQRQEFLLECEVLSAMRNPLGGRSSASVEKLALRVRPRGTDTRLQLLAEGDEQPLEGYEVFARKPLPPEADTSDATERLGMTDWRGSINVPADEFPLRLIYVKNGSHLIARLPVLPGYLPERTAILPRDDNRLEAEAFVEGMETTVMDLVARREILAARIRRRVDEGKIADAATLLDQAKQLPTRDDLERMLAGRQQALTSADEREQRRIDLLLRGTRILLDKYLDADKIADLRQLVEKATTAKPEAPPPAEEPAQEPPATE